MSALAGKDRIGELVGAKYRIVRLVAEGGMGVVYEAQHAVVRRRFAVKFLRPDLAERRDILTRFQREAQAAGSLESENVAASVDFGIVADGTPYIVMEFLAGESLAHLLERERRLPVARAADVVAQACRGIQAAHAAGIVHRDLKPHNLFVCRRDDGSDLIKVLDFGVAKLQVLDEKSLATHTGMVLGTPAYMAPEQARGDKVVDSRVDVYALGAILYELLSGEKPHPGDSYNAILYHISTQPAVPLDVAQLGLPAPLLEVVGRALASDPETRFATAEALGQALAPWARREVWPAPATAEMAAALVPTDAAPAPSMPARAPSPRPSRARGRGALMALGAGTAAVAVVVAIGVAPRGQPPAPLPAAVARTAVPEAPLAAAAPVRAVEAAAPAAASPPPPPAPPAAPVAQRRRRAGAPAAHPAAEPPRAATPAPAATAPTAATAAAAAAPASAPVTLDPANPYE